MVAKWYTFMYVRTYVSRYAYVGRDDVVRPPLTISMISGSKTKEMHEGGENRRGLVDANGRIFQMLLHISGQRGYLMDVTCLIK